ncbi:HD domain-containing protein [Intestinimonas butyriciproducens]|uniref:HD domain-containing protein n=1 Tax=Intestinimonas butyriciproducens TaxID=1297617 RepID=UPI001AB05CF8|nr:HD domain-containing protein [Intestinimonas butyriciproducens]MBO3281096.1 hydrolase [Intestinimonas butyriciproducens]
MKEKFLEIYRKNITRPGADKLLAWLETTDFFTAPASTRFHLSRPGGLVDHSVHVYERLDNLVTDEEGYPGSTFGEDFTISDETIAICGLLHDICKANFYTVEMRNRKNEQGQWEKYPFYVVDDQLPYGHGEKSVYIISGFMKLTREEAMAIRWHMGFSDTDFKGGGFSVGNAFGKFPLAVLTHIADLQATYLDEAEGE